MISDPIPLRHIITDGAVQKTQQDRNNDTHREDIQRWIHRQERRPSQKETQILSHIQPDTQIQTITRKHLGFSSVNQV